MAGQGPRWISPDPAAQVECGVTASESPYAPQMKAKRKNSPPGPAPSTAVPPRCTRRGGFGPGLTHPSGGIAATIALATGVLVRAVVKSSSLRFGQIWSSQVAVSEYVVTSRFL
jgi:hypothetical protein